MDMGVNTKEVRYTRLATGKEGKGRKGRKEGAGMVELFRNGVPCVAIIVQCHNSSVPLFVYLSCLTQAIMSLMTTISPLRKAILSIYLHSFSPLTQSAKDTRKKRKKG